MNVTCYVWLLAAALWGAVLVQGAWYRHRRPLYHVTVWRWGVERSNASGANTVTVLAPFTWRVHGSLADVQRHLPQPELGDGQVVSRIDIERLR